MKEQQNSAGNQGESAHPNEVSLPGGEAKRELETTRDHPAAMPFPSAHGDLTSQEGLDEQGESRSAILVELVEEVPSPAAWPSRRLPARTRRKTLPVVLFLATCLSTFFVGACLWVPLFYVMPVADGSSPYSLGVVSTWNTGFMPLRRAMVSHWDEGLIYMLCVLAILLTHEMGHFLVTLRYRVPASFPFFLPLPISFIGTLGAVIGMDGSRANRKEIFDIGIAGPLAGLAVALPVLCVGIAKLDFTQAPHGMFELDMPLIARALLDYFQPDGYKPGQEILQGHLNPYFMAGWVGLLVTGLNMMPVSQLDGGHVAYSLLGKRAHWVARGCIFLAIAYLIYTRTLTLLVMIVLIMLIGTDHPPTRDDRVRLGWFRTFLGCCSLAIPVLCFAPRVMVFLTPEGAGG